MKKLFFISLILISFQGIGQVYQWLPQFGYQMNRVQADSVLKIPSDTIRNKSGIARIGITIYAGNGTYWTAVSGGSSYWQSSTTNNIDNTNSGNVGIGNTNPQYKLDVTGTINSTGNISTSQTVSANGGLEVVESFVPKVTLKNQSGYGGYFNLRNAANQQKVNISSYEDNYVNQPLAVGNSSVDASAQLDVTASSKGLLIPRLTTTQRNNITTPATGLLIWNTTDSTLQQYRGLSGWSAIGGGSISAPSGEIVYGTGGGTTSSSNLSYNSTSGEFTVNAVSYFNNDVNINGGGLFSSSSLNLEAGTDADVTLNATGVGRVYFNGVTKLNKDSVAIAPSTKWKLAIDTTTGLIVRDSTGGGSTYSAGYGLSLASTTFSADSLQLSTKAWRQKGLDSLGAITALKSTTLSNGWGLLGGGDLSANRTYTADTVNLSTKANGTKQKDSVVSLLSTYLPLSGGTYTTTSGNGLALTSSTVTSGNLVSLTSTGTAATSNTKTVLNIASSGANATASQTVTGQKISVTNTGTTSTNVGLNIAVSGATNNYGIIANGISQLGGTNLSSSTWYTGGAVAGIKIQNPTTNSRTSLALVGGGGTGLGLVADMWLFNTSDITTNYSGIVWGYETGSSAWGFNVVKGGTETAKGIYFNSTNGQNAATSNLFLPTSGNVLIKTTTDNSTLTVNGSFATAYAAKIANYTATASDYTIDCTSGTFTVTLPTAVGITGRIYVITNSGAGTITVATTSSQTFANVIATPTTLTMANVGTRTVQSNGANWLVLSSF